MNKAELITQVQEATGYKKKLVTDIIDSTLDTITGNLAKGEEVHITKFGSFQVKLRKGRNCRNLKSGETVYVPEHKSIVFKPGVMLKDTCK